MFDVLLVNDAKYLIKKTTRKYTNLNSRNSIIENATCWSKSRRHFKSYAIEISKFNNNDIKNFVVRKNKQSIKWLSYSKELDFVVFKEWTVNDQRRFLLSIVFRKWASKKKIISTNVDRTKSKFNEINYQNQWNKCKMISIMTKQMIATDDFVKDRMSSI